MNDQQIHSSAYLTDVRDYWWNPDFMSLMAKRWKLNQIKSMLDVGCGIGHWGQMLASFLHAEANIAGIDLESLWVEKATTRATEKGLSTKATYSQGTAENIPYPDNHFDMVTCQTVLIHVKDVNIALREMLRVLKPGGLLAVAEPNNLVHSLIFNNLNFNDPIENILDAIRFHLICNRGKEALNDGNNSRGDIIPEYFKSAGLKDIQVYINDLADYFIPPYSSPREQATIAEIKERRPSYWKETRAEAKRNFLAGGGTLEEFLKFVPEDEEQNEQENLLNLYQEQTLCTSGGVILYLISGRK